MIGTALLTGASGFVGTYLQAALREAFPDLRLVGLSVPSTSSTGGCDVDLCDAGAVDAVVERVRPDIVIHLAAQASVAKLATERNATFAINVGGTLNLALAVAAHAPNATFIFASSAEVYGASFLRGRLDESAATVPLNAYARSKLLAEQTLAAVLPDTARLIVLRLFNHVGPGQREDFVLPSWAAQIARIESGAQTELAVGNLDVGRDFLDVRDAVAAYVALLQAGTILPRHFCCNVASGETYRLSECLDTFQALARQPLNIVVDPARQRASDVPTVCGDASLLRHATGWRPSRPLKQTLADLLQHARQMTATAPSPV